MPKPNDISVNRHKAGGSGSGGPHPDDLHRQDGSGLNIAEDDFIAVGRGDFHIARHTADKYHRRVSEVRGVTESR